MTVEEVRGSLDLTDNGAIKNSIRNCLTVFQNDPVLQGAVRYNILTERIDIVILSILVYTFFSRMFDLMLPPVAKHSIVVA